MVKQEKEITRPCCNPIGTDGKVCSGTMELREFTDAVIMNCDYQDDETLHLCWYCDTCGDIICIDPTTNIPEEIQNKIEARKALRKLGDEKEILAFVQALIKDMEQEKNPPEPMFTKEFIEKMTGVDWGLISRKKDD